MRKLCIVFFLFLGINLFSPAFLRAQIQYSVNNLLRYGDGREYLGGLEPKKEYIENLMNVRLFWKDFTVGFRYLYDNPPEFGPRFTGLKKRYVEFERSGLQIRVGDFYTLYGRGLAMNLFENRGINYDTGLDGLRGSYQSDYFNAIFAAGKFEYVDLLNPQLIEPYTVRSGNIEIKPFSFLRFGGSFVHVDADIPNQSYASSVKANIPEYNLSFSWKGIDLTASYAKKNSFIERTFQSTGIIESLERSGEGIYGSLSYSGDAGYGVTLEYKDYRFDKVAPNQRTPNRDTRMLPVQNPPTALKEHSFTLLTRAPHIIDFNDEIGFQIDAFYQITPELTLNLNAAAASRHESYVKDPATNRIRVNERTKFFPSMKSDYAPYWEAYMEGEYYFTDESYLRVAADRRYDLTNDFLVPKVVSSSTVPMRLEYMISSPYSIAVNLELQWVNDQSLRETPKHSNQFLALTFTKAPQWALTVRTEMTSNEEDPSKKKFWAAGEATYRLGNAHTLTASYGSERGGLICASGICRQVNPFNGFRLTVLSQI